MSESEYENVYRAPEANISWLVPTLIGSVPLLGGIFSLINILYIFKEDCRCIHDLIAGTIVVKA